MPKPKTKAPEPLRDAAELILKTVECVAQKCDLDVSGDPTELYRNAALSEGEDDDVNVTRIPSPGCICLGVEHLGQAKAKLLAATLSDGAARIIIEGSLNAVGEALKELLPLRTVADSYDKRKDSAFPEFVNAADFEHIFPKKSGVDYQSEWGTPSRLHEFVSAVNRWLRNYAEDLIRWRSSLIDAIERTAELEIKEKSVHVANAVPVCEIQKSILRYMLINGFDSSVNPISRGGLCEDKACNLDDEVCKDALKKLRKADLLQSIGNHPRLKHYLSPHGCEVAEYIKPQW